MISITQLAEEMKAFALEHPMRPGQLANDGCAREYEYSDQYTVVCVLTVNLMDEINKHGWQLSMAHKDKKTELPNDVVQDFLNVFFGSTLVEDGGKILELPRFPIFPVQRQFIAILEGNEYDASEIGGG